MSKKFKIGDSMSDENNNNLVQNSDDHSLQGPKKKVTLQDNLMSIRDYNKVLVKNLPKEIFKLDPSRLLVGVVFYALAAGIIYSIMNFELIWPLKIFLGVALGMLSGGLAFLAHEVIHGSVVKNKNLQDLIGFFGFAPYLISPTYWRFWHNHLHHGHTQLLYKDPDAFPTKMVWKKSKFMKWAFEMAPGSGTKKSYLYFFWWFSFQAVLNQAYMRFGNKMWNGMNHKKVTMEFIFQLAIAAAYINFVGFSHLIYLVIIPFAVQNYTVMSYISTNHNISPYTNINDPLVNSLSVTNNPFLEAVHLNFGYHTEHHLFPKMPMKHAKIVSEKLKELFPTRYQIMPKWQAVKMLYNTPRIYKDRETLVNPHTGEEFKTIVNSETDLGVIEKTSAIH